MTRQLQLPVLRNHYSTAVRRPPATRAQRDLSVAEFIRALARNRFAPIGSLHFYDLEAKEPCVIQAVIVGQPPRVEHRATLAKLLRMRREQGQNRHSESTQNRRRQSVQNQGVGWSERQDSNLRPSAPKADALPGCATLRHHGRSPIHGPP